MPHNKYYSLRNIILICSLILAIGVFAAYKIYTLRSAHSSFENYYAFRGCVQLIERTDTYGICRLTSGETIKLVNIKDKWYLDGDGPGVF